MRALAQPSLALVSKTLCSIKLGTLESAGGKREEPMQVQCPNCGQQIQVAAGINSEPSAAAPPGGSGGAPPTGPPVPETGKVPPPQWPPPGGMPPGGAPPPGGPPPPRGPSYRHDTPWERRKELGFVNALLETWKQTMISPDKFWSSVRPDGRWEDALFYSWVIGAITLILTLLIKIPLQSMIAAQVRASMDRLASLQGLPPEARSYLETFMSLSTGLKVWWTGLQLLFWPIGLFITAGLVHVFCILFGSAANGFWATFRAIAYAQAPFVFSIFAPVPCVGAVLLFAAVIYYFVLAIIGVSRLQDSSAGKAAAAVLATPVLLCCCCCGLVVFAGGVLKSMISGGN